MLPVARAQPSYPLLHSRQTKTLEFLRRIESNSIVMYRHPDVAGSLFDTDLDLGCPGVARRIAEALLNDT